MGYIFLILFLGYLLGGIDILFNKKEKVGIFVGENRVSKKKIREKEEEEKLYIKYSIFEKHYIMCFAVFFIIVIFSVGIAWGYLNLMIKLFTIIILLLVITVIRFFKKDYIMKRYSNYSISISEKKKEIYIMDDFFETDKKVIINYENTNFNSVKFNFYYFQNNVMPKNYKKYNN